MNILNTNFQFFIKLFIIHKDVRYYGIKITDDDASIYQSKTGEYFNYDIEEAIKVMNSDETVDVKKSGLFKGLFLAVNLFSQRLAKRRILTIHGCGNCLPYTLKNRKLIRYLSEANIIVNSYDIHNIKNLDDVNSMDSEVPYGYDNKNIYLFNKDEKIADQDYLDSYSIDHKMNFCSKAAIKTNGVVLDATKMNETLFPKVFQHFYFSLKKFSYKLGSCQKIDTPLGDFSMFGYKATQLESNDEF